MYTTIQSTIRRLSTTLALTGTCAIIAACSSQKTNGWFHLGHKEQPQPIETIIQCPILSSEQPPPDQTSTSPNATVPAAPQLAAPDPNIRPDQQHAQLQDQKNTTKTTPTLTIDTDIEEIVALYRRLHVETDQTARSKLIVELLSDPREPVRLLGFDLASRDLSSGATLSPQAANAAVSLLNDPLPSVRIGAAHLITRLALPDAMTLLTKALATEQNPSVAEPLLRAIERWPNPEAREDVIRWFQSSGPTRSAAANAAWAIAELQLWDPQSHFSILRAVYRDLPDDQLSNADLRLIAATGTQNDINRLIALARDPSYPNQMNAAQALTHSPAGVDPLLKLASDNPKFSPHAAAAIETHRLNPNGIRLLAALTWNDDQARIEAITRACDKLDHEQLSDAILIARQDNSINDTLSIKLLSRLVAGSQSVSPSSAPGVVLLAQLELKNQRPDRSIEILSLLPTTNLDPTTALNATNTKAAAHILLAEYDQAAALTLDPNTWLSTLNTHADSSTKIKIAQAITDHSITLTQDQQSLINSILNPRPDP